MIICMVWCHDNVAITVDTPYPCLYPHIVYCAHSDQCMDSVTITSMLCDHYLVMCQHFAAWLWASGPHFTLTPHVIMATSMMLWHNGLESRTVVPVLIFTPCLTMHEQDLWWLLWCAAQFRWIMSLLHTGPGEMRIHQCKWVHENKLYIDNSR